MHSYRMHRNFQVGPPCDLKNSKCRLNCQGPMGYWVGRLTMAEFVRNGQNIWSQSATFRGKQAPYKEGNQKALPENPKLHAEPQNGPHHGRL